MSARRWNVWHNAQGLLGVFDADGHLFKDLDEVITKIEAVPLLLAALDAHAAWGLAEENGSGVTWEGRSELANYANWLTRKARALAAGKTFDEPYEGVPHMIVWPEAEIHRASEDIAAEMVRTMLAKERQP